MPWHDEIRQTSEASASRCVNDSSKPPHVAFCIAGAARGFATRLVQAMLRHHLIEQLAPGGRGAVFLQLKMADTNKLSGPGDYGIHFEQHVASLSGLLATLRPGTWLRQLVAEASIVNGSGAFLGTGWHGEPGTDASLALRGPDVDAWRRWGSRKCPFPWGNCSNRTPSQQCGTAEERLILAPLATAWCGAAIARHEASRAIRFDLVVFARPDLLLRAPVAPWCEWQWEDGATAAVCGASGSDGVWIVRRARANRVLRRAEVHARCNGAEGVRARKIGKGRADGFGGGASAHTSCCGGAEALLSASLLALPKLRVDPRSCAKLSWPDNTFLRQVQRRTPCTLKDQIACRHRQRHVCDTALSHRYVPGGLWSRIQSWHSSLTLQTAILLRKLFVPDAGGASACKEATDVDL